MVNTALTEYDPPKFITEREVRIAGQTSNRLSALRGALTQGLRSGSIHLATSNGSQSISLPQVDMEAVVGLLIERDEAFLIGLNIELEK